MKTLSSGLNGLTVQQASLHQRLQNFRLDRQQHGTYIVDRCMRKLFPHLLHVGTVYRQSIQAYIRSCRDPINKNSPWRASKQVSTFRSTNQIIFSQIMNKVRRMQRTLRRSISIHQILISFPFFYVTHFPFVQYYFPSFFFHSINFYNFVVSSDPENELDDVVDAWPIQRRSDQGANTAVYRSLHWNTDPPCVDVYIDIYKCCIYVCLAIG